MVLHCSSSLRETVRIFPVSLLGADTACLAVGAQFNERPRRKPLQNRFLTVYGPFSTVFQKGRPERMPIESGVFASQSSTRRYPPHTNQVLTNYSVITRLLALSLALRADTLADKKSCLNPAQIKSHHQIVRCASPGVWR